MSNHENRRNFLAQGAATTAGLFATRTALGQQPETTSPSYRDAESVRGGEFPRFHAGLGGPVNSPTDRGKLVNGFRRENLEPIALSTPDLPKLPFTMVGGVKNFHLRPMPVQQELLPGQTFNFYGYNGTMPSPTIEVNQGDRVRVVVHNELPEATTIHWHGLECPNDMDGIPFITQKMIAPGATYVYEFTVHQAISMAYLHTLACKRLRVPLACLWPTQQSLLIHPSITISAYCYNNSTSSIVSSSKNRTKRLPVSISSPPCQRTHEPTPPALSHNLLMKPLTQVQLTQCDKNAPFCEAISHVHPFSFVLPIRMEPT